MGEKILNLVPKDGQMVRVVITMTHMEKDDKSEVHVTSSGLSRMEILGLLRLTESVLVTEMGFAA